MRILGIDPGLDATGYGVIETENGQGPRLIEAGLIRTKPSESLPRRLAAIARQIRAVILQHQPQLMAVEDLYSHYKTPKPAILMGHVRGVVLGTAALSDVPVASYLPTRVKRSVVGRGHASKRQVARLVRVRLRLAGGGEVPADVTDALAVALCYADGHRAERAMTKPTFSVAARPRGGNAPRLPFRVCGPGLVSPLGSPLPGARRLWRLDGLVGRAPARAPVPPDFPSGGSRTLLSTRPTRPLFQRSGRALG